MSIGKAYLDIGYSSIDTDLLSCEILDKNGKQNTIETVNNFKNRL